MKSKHLLFTFLMAALVTTAACSGKNNSATGDESYLNTRLEELAEDGDGAVDSGDTRAAQDCPTDDSAPKELDDTPFGQMAEACNTSRDSLEAAAAEYGFDPAAADSPEKTTAFLNVTLNACPPAIDSFETNVLHASDEITAYIDEHDIDQINRDIDLTDAQSFEILDRLVRLANKGEKFQAVVNQLAAPFETSLGFVSGSNSVFLENMENLNFIYADPYYGWISILTPLQESFLGVIVMSISDRALVLDNEPYFIDFAVNGDGYTVELLPFGADQVPNQENPTDTLPDADTGLGN